MHSPQLSGLQCSSCNSILDENAKFCGECGALAPARKPVSPPPSFARVRSLQSEQKAAELEAEQLRLMIQLTRERALLLFHWGMFIFLNVVGIWLAFKCYYEFIGDEMTKIVIASTPFLFINSLALMCITLINGTRREIARVKERLSFIRFKIEFGHLIN